MILLGLIMLTPLVFLSYWLTFFFFTIFTFLFLIKISMNYMFINISYSLGMDLLSYLMILLSFWICMLMILASKKIYENNMNWQFFLFVNLVMIIVLYLVFSSMNLFIFYLFFEFSLIPVLFMIMGWGYQPERIQAGIYLLFYTLFASLPMMISIFYYYSMFMSLDYFFMKLDNLNSVLLYVFMNFVFFIKMPMYLVHLWLPKAHVEAPIAGSMILAGVMLKLGGYGLIRLMILFIEIGLKINIYFIMISLIGGFFISLICMNQSDLKSLIAYSSVAHMGLVMSGILTLNYWGMSGALVMMVAHGLCSSGLFCLSNISYERIMSRSIYLNKGLMNLIPSLSLWWFLLCSSNMAAPPSMNLMGEIMLINSIVSWSEISMIFLALMSFFSAVYSLYLYSFTQHGKFYSGVYSNMMGYMSEYKLLFLHWFPLNLFVLKGEILYFMF
uniref:NADH dehydrogenase subunit 4 n=1 Tax=Cladiscus yunnanus TaxID=3028309 RepID=UPI0023D81211|nr:NADH dehydrogenase subunit 4 [Cladiscus yunnanus]WDE20695.1 NADH dehydrogenase subunit 4 [Cladiscus yunnanus]